MIISKFTWKSAMILVLIWFGLGLIISMSEQVAVIFDIFSFESARTFGLILIYFACCFILIFAKRKFNIQYFHNWKFPKVKEVIVVILIALTYQYICSFFSIENLYEVIIHNADAKIRYSNFPQNAHCFVQLVISCMLAPLVEELFYRRLIFRELLFCHSFFHAALISSALFALTHFFNIHVIFFGGLIAAYIYLYTNSLFLIMLYHFTFNLAVHSLDYFHLYEHFILSETYYISVVILLLSSIVGIVFLIKRKDRINFLLLDEIKKAKLIVSNNENR